MNILNQYQFLIKKITNIRIIFLLSGLILFINIIIFPIFNIQRDKPLDTRLYYTPEYASDYISQLEGDGKIRSMLMHGTVDLIYPIIYTVLFSCIIFYLKGNRKLISLPLLILFVDLLENSSIILALLFSPQSRLFKVFIITASISTPLKWGFVLLCFSVIMFLIIRRIYEK